MPSRSYSASSCSSVARAASRSPDHICCNPRIDRGVVYTDTSVHEDASIASSWSAIASAIASSTCSPRRNRTIACEATASAVVAGSPLRSRMVHGCLPVRERSVEVALIDVHPREIELDPCDEGRVLARLRQRLHQRGTHTAARGSSSSSRTSGRGSPRGPGPAACPPRRAGAARSPGERRRRRSDTRRLRGLRSRSRSASSSGVTLQCQLRELCGRIGRAARASVPRRLVEFGRDLCIGTDRRERQVPRTLLRVGRRAPRAADGAPARQRRKPSAYTVDPSSGCENLTRSPVRSITPAASAAAEALDALRRDARHGEHRCRRSGA